MSVIAEPELIGRPPVAMAPALAAPPTPVVEEQPMGATQRTVIGASLMLATVVLMSQLVAIWPAVAEVTTPVVPHTAHAKLAIPVTPLLFGLVNTTFTTDVVLMAMVLIVGALGALVGVTRRYLYFAGREQLTKRDEWSYLMRPVQGAMLALIVYFTLRGGYLGQDATAPVNPYGVAALSALVGLFTRHAISKLTDVFDTLFGKPKEEEHPVQIQKADD